MYERGETFTHAATVRNFSTKAKENPDTITITITSPDGTILVTAASMVSDSITAGDYTYNYDIPANALYGEYKVEVDSTIDSAVTTGLEHFVVFSWDMVHKIRRYSGIEKTSVKDDDVAGIGLEAYHEVMDDVYEYHRGITGICDPDYGVMFNGTNTVIRTKHTPIADHDFDGYVYGTGNISRESDWVDITGYWYDSDYAKHETKVTVTDNVSGRITVTQTDDSAIPSTHQGVYFEYWVEWESFNGKILKDAIAYLASHNLILRMTELHNATAADLPSNQRKIELNLNRFERKYEKLLDMISKPAMEGV